MGNELIFQKVEFHKAEFGWVSVTARRFVCTSLEIDLIQEYFARS